MIDDEQRLADELADFTAELCGITPKEVLGLLALILKRDNQVYSNVVGKKRVRRFSAKLLGMSVNLTEVNGSYTSKSERERIHKMFSSASVSTINPFDGGIGSGIDYHVETDEWEFKVNVTATNSLNALDLYFGGFKVKVRRPWFEGDETDYKHKMSMIRLMGLSSVSSEDIYV